MELQIDRLGRRQSCSPSSTGKRVTPQSRDLLWFGRLREHGALPSSFLLAYAKDTHRSAKRTRDRLTDLYHESNTPDEGRYLELPSQQFRTLKGGYNQHVYAPTDRALMALERNGLRKDLGNHFGGPWLHQHMVACITASIELAALARVDISYISGRDILNRANAELSCPTNISASGVHVITKALKPDAIFGLRYQTDAGERFRFFVIEADRSTEPATSKNFHRKSYQRTFLQYRDYIEQGRYKDHLKLSAPLLVLNVVPDQRRLAQLIRLTQKLMPNGCSYQLFQSWDEFGEVYQPPHPNFGLLNHPWQRAGLPDLQIG